VLPEERPAAGFATTRGFQAFSPDSPAPEEVTHGRTGPWPDVHAPRLMFTELLTGERPFGSLDENGH
jgi:hypothetical protein